MPDPRRKRLQFGLGTLLLAVTLFAVWLAMVVNRVNGQKRSVAEIVKAGGRIQFDYQRDPAGQRIPDAEPPAPVWLRKLMGEDYFRKVVVVDFATPSSGPSKVNGEGLSCFESLPDVEWIDLDQNRAVPAEGLVHLRNLKNLRVISMYRCNVSGVGFVHLAQLPHLQRLALSYTPLTPDGVAQLGKLRTLESLSMAHTAITDDDLAALTSLRNLKLLWIDNTAVTDRGLAHIERLTALESLSLPAGISDAGLERIQNALPHCQIRRVK